MKIQNLTLYQGDTHVFRVALQAVSDGLKSPLDLSDADFVMEVRAAGRQTVQPRITVGDNQITLFFPASLTQQMQGIADYDLRGIHPWGVKTYMRGKVSITPCITPALSAAEETGAVREENIEIDVGGALIIHQHITQQGGDGELLDEMRAQIEQLKISVDESKTAAAQADESGEIEALQRKVGLVEAAIAENGSLQGRLAALEQKKAEMEMLTLQIAPLRLRVEALEQNPTIAALQAELKQAETRIAAAEESREIQALASEISGLNQKIADEKQKIIAENADKIAKLAGQISQLQQQINQGSHVDAQIQEIRALLKLPKREKIHVQQSMWSQGGYPFATVRFANTYKNPKIDISIEYTGLTVSFLDCNKCNVTSTGLQIRSNFNYPRIDVDYSVWVTVEEFEIT